MRVEGITKEEEDAFRHDEMCQINSSRLAAIMPTCD